MNGKIRVIVVDDSVLIRKIISDMINEEDDIEVIGVARNGTELLKKLEYEKPDLITLDVEMDNMNGIEVLKELNKREEAYRILMVSSLTTKSSTTTIECLRLGALDFISKPSKRTSDLKTIKEDLVSKIRVLAKVKKNNIRRVKDIEVRKIKTTGNIIEKNKGKIQAVAIGASTGGPRALNEIITKLPEDLGVPIFIVQHMPVGFTKTFSERLDKHSTLRVCEGFEGQIIGRNVVYIAPGGYHMEINKNKKIMLTKEPPLWGVRPAVDKLFITASEVYGDGLLTVVLTGMGRDGAEGSAFSKKNNGYCISQDEKSSLIYGMPRAAYETGCIDEVIPLEKMAEVISKIVKG